MTAEILLSILLRVQLVASAAILLVLFLRPLVSRWCGARIAYGLWLIVLLAVFAGELPARSEIVLVQSATSSAQSMPERSIASAALQPVDSLGPVGADLLMAAWLLGFGMLFSRSILRTRLLAASPSAGPALIGVLRPRLVLPPDFTTRFNAEERALILAHEETHRVSRHTTVNALVELLRCASWFNPLVHLAAVRFRADQELACDATVIAAYPSARQTYAGALLKAQIAGVHPPLGCMWTSSSARRLGERIVKLSQHLPSQRHRHAGVAAIFGVGIASGYAAWAQQPPQIINVPVASPAVINAGAAASQVQQPIAETVRAEPNAPVVAAPKTEIRPDPQGEASTSGQPIYSGERMNASFQDVPVRTLLKVIAETGGHSVVVSDSVKGNANLRVDNVPWDQVFDMVLKMKGLDKRVQDDVIIVGPPAELGELEKAAL